MVEKNIQIKKLLSMLRSFFCVQYLAFDYLGRFIRNNTKKGIDKVGALFYNSHIKEKGYGGF